MTLHSRRTDPRPPLPDWIQAGFETLEPAFDDADPGISRTEAVELLLTECDQIENEADATRAIDRLLERGWLYEVGDTIRKTS
jgi:hypothetical protein